MAELDSEQKLAIVQALACFTTPAEVTVMMKEQFDLEVVIQQVVKYDPTKPSYQGAEKWRELFNETRKAYIEQVSEVPIANQGYRLQQLQKNLDKAVKAKNFVLANATLKQAAEEVGGVLTNDRNLRIDDNRDRGFRDLTPEERRDMVGDMLRNALIRDDQQTAETVETVQ